MNLPIAYLNCWTGDGPAALMQVSETAGEARAEPGAEFGAEPLANPLAINLAQDALHDSDLSAYRALLIPAHADQRYLMTQRDKLAAYLHTGGTMVVNGHIAYPFLPWLAPFRPSLASGIDGLRVHRARPHAVFEGVDADHLTFRRGVAGFYARGANPAPAGAVVLNTVGPDALPVDWLLCLAGGGRLLMHSGNDLWMYAGSADTAGRIVPQLFGWLQEEAA